MLVKNYGLFWREDEVFWGRGNNAGTLLGVLSSNTTAEPVDFRDQAGVYVLYADFDMVYVGQAGNGYQKLFGRLKQHRRDALSGRWNQFSWFGTRKVLKRGGLAAEVDWAHTTHAQVLNHIEAILIQAAEPPLNRQGGRFGKKAGQFIQHRDTNLGPTVEDMIYDLWHAKDHK